MLDIQIHEEYYFEQMQKKYQLGQLSASELIEFENIYKKKIQSHYPSFCKFILPEYEFISFHNELMQVVDDAINDSIKNQRINIIISEVPPQSGKALRNSCKIKTSNGWKIHGDIQVGDIVDNALGGYSIVTGVFPQGARELYRITFEDGRYVDADLNHLWEVKCREFSKNKIINTQEIIRLLQLNTYKNRLYIPKYIPINEIDKSLLLDPYLLGALLGDGSLFGNIKFTNADEFVIKKVNDLLHYYDCELNQHAKYDYGVRRIIRKRTENPIKVIIKQLNLLGTNSATKFIPIEFLNASYNQRIQLIQGLMDTDGSICKSGTIELTTVSKQLALDLQYLIRSIGGLCEIKNKISTYTYKNEKKIGLPAYRLRIRHANHQLFFSTPRKLERCQSWHRRSNAQLRIKSVKYIGNDECTCIMVDNEKHLYVTDDFIVTHNTTLLGVSSASYVFGRFPNKTTIYQTYNEDRAISVAKSKIMPIMNRKFYREVFPHVRFKMEIDTSKKDLKEIYKKKAATHTDRIISNVDFEGKIICAGVDNSITGEPGHFIIYDDFFKGRKDAISAKIRDNVWGSFKSDLLTRMHPDTVLIIFATRWHNDDPIGRIKELIKNKEIKKNSTEEEKILFELLDRIKIRTFEAFKTQRTMGDEYSYDKRAIGQPLWEKYKEKYILHRAIDRVDFECMYQANPVTLDEVSLKRELIHYYYSYEDMQIQEVYIGVDLILNHKSRNSKDETAFTVWNKTSDNKVYLLEYFAERIGFKASKEKLKELCKKYGVAYSSSIIEGRTYGYALEEELEDEIYGLIVKEPIGSKKQRFAPCVEMFENGQVLLPHPSICPEINYYVDQLCNFTGDPKDTDDLVDSSSWALNHIKTSTFTIDNNGELIRGMKNPKPLLSDMKIDLGKTLSSGNRLFKNLMRR